MGLRKLTISVDDEGYQETKEFQAAREISNTDDAASLIFKTGLNRVIALKAYAKKKGKTSKPRAAKKEKAAAKPKAAKAPKEKRAAKAKSPKRAAKAKTAKPAKAKAKAAPSAPSAKKSPLAAKVAGGPKAKGLGPQKPALGAPSINGASVTTTEVAEA